MTRIAILASHPIPYHIPLYRELSRRSGIDVEVFFAHDHGVKPTFDQGFGREVLFDVPLLEGYQHRFPRNYARVPGFTFAGQVNPEVPLLVTRGVFDALIVQGYQSVTNVAVVFAPRNPRTRVLLRSESNLLRPRTAGILAAKQVLVRGLFRQIDHFLAIGSCSQAYYEAYGVSPSRITLSPYSVDNAYFEERSAGARRDPKETRARWGLPVDRPIFVFCSKIAPHKRPMDLLHAFALARKEAACALVYIGVGSSDEDLKTEIARLGLSSDVFLLGFRNQSELPELYGACDVFVHPSESETWGTVVNEAMACGLAVCLSDRVGAAYDLVRGNGAMFPVGGIQQLSTLLIRWARGPDEIAKMKQASSERIRQWNVERSADGVVEGVRKALAA